MVFEVAGDVFRVGGGLPEFAGTAEVGGGFVGCAAGPDEADQAVLRSVEWFD